MNLNQPKNVTFIVSVLLVLLGILGTMTVLPVISGAAFWFVVLGFIILAAGNLVAGL